MPAAAPAASFSRSALATLSPADANGRGAVSGSASSKRYAAAIALGSQIGSSELSDDSELCWADEASVGDRATALRRADLRIGVRYYGMQPRGCRVVRISATEFETSSPSPASFRKPGKCGSPSPPLPAKPPRGWRRVEMPSKGVKVPWVSFNRCQARESGCTSQVLTSAVEVSTEDATLQDLQLKLVQKDKFIEDLSAELVSHRHTVSELKGLIAELRTCVDNQTDAQESPRTQDREHDESSAASSPVASPLRLEDNLDLVSSLHDAAAPNASSATTSSTATPLESQHKQVLSLEAILRGQLAAATDEIKHLQDDLAEERQRRGSHDSSAATNAFLTLQRIQPFMTDAAAAQASQETQTDEDRCGESISDGPSRLHTLDEATFSSIEALTPSRAGIAHNRACASARCHMLCPLDESQQNTKQPIAAAQEKPSKLQFENGQPVKVRSKTYIWRDAVIVDSNEARRVVLVHYSGFDRQFDEWISEHDCSERVLSSVDWQRCQTQFWLRCSQLLELTMCAGTEHLLAAVECTAQLPVVCPLTGLDVGCRVPACLYITQSYVCLFLHGSAGLVVPFSKIQSIEAHRIEAAVIGGSREMELENAIKIGKTARESFLQHGMKSDSNLFGDQNSLQTIGALRITVLIAGEEKPDG
eukprot:SAG31_NODE_50_length_30520_cov_89.906712_33_plen_649_part_00